MCFPSTFFSTLYAPVPLLLLVLSGWRFEAR